MLNPNEYSEDAIAYDAAIRAAATEHSTAHLKQLLGECSNHWVSDCLPLFLFVMDILRETNDADLQSVSAYCLWELGLPRALLSYSTLIQLLFHSHDIVRSYAAELLREA